MKAEIQGLADKFKKFSDRAMKEAEAANGARNWVKGERKETESETWMEAYRMTKKLIDAPPPAESKEVPKKSISDFGGWPFCG